MRKSSSASGSRALSSRYCRIIGVDAGSPLMGDRPGRGAGRDGRGPSDASSGGRQRLGLRLVDREDTAEIEDVEAFAGERVRGADDLELAVDLLEPHVQAEERADDQGREGLEPVEIHQELVMAVL